MENSVYHIADEKACSEENTEDMAKRPFAKEIILSVNHGFPQLPQQEDKLFELTGKTTGRNDGRLLDFLDFTGWDHRAIQLLTCSIQDAKGIQRSSGLPPQFQRGWVGGITWVSIGQTPPNRPPPKLWGRDSWPAEQWGREPPKDPRLVVALAIDSGPGELLCGPCPAKP